VKWIFVALAFTLGCGHLPTDPQTGIAASIRRGPITPVSTQGVDNSAPVAGAVVLVSIGGSRYQSGDDGRQRSGDHTREPGQLSGLGRQLSRCHEHAAAANRPGAERCVCLGKRAVRHRNPLTTWDG